MNFWPFIVIFATIFGLELLYAAGAPKVEILNVPGWGTLTVSHRGGESKVKIREPHSKKLKQLLASECHRSANFILDASPSVGEDLLTAYFVPQSPVEELKKAKANFYQTMVEHGHWNDTKRVTAFRKEVLESLQETARRRERYRNVMSKAEEAIYYYRQRLQWGRSLNARQKERLNMAIGEQEKKIQMAFNVLQAFKHSGPGDVRRLVDMQAERYGRLIESRPAVDLRPGTPLYQLGETIKKLELQISTQRELDP